MKNHWNKISDILYQSLYFDVYFQYGDWYASMCFLGSKRYGPFDTAEQAMYYIDNVLTNN